MCSELIFTPYSTPLRNLYWLGPQKSEEKWSVPKSRLKIVAGNSWYFAPSEKCSNLLKNEDYDLKFWLRTHWLPTIWGSITLTIFINIFFFILGWLFEGYHFIAFLALLKRRSEMVIVVKKNLNLTSGNGRRGIETKSHEISHFWHFWPHLDLGS